MSNASRLNRRQWLGAAGAVTLAAGTSACMAGAARKRPRVAAVVTEFTYRSHAHVLLENFLEPYYFNGRLTDPGVDVVSLYVDQVPEGRDEPLARMKAAHALGGIGLPAKASAPEIVRVLAQETDAHLHSVCTDSDTMGAIGGPHDHSPRRRSRPRPALRLR